MEELEKDINKLLELYKNCKSDKQKNIILRDIYYGLEYLKKFDAVAFNNNECRTLCYKAKNTVNNFNNIVSSYFISYIKKIKICLID